MIKDAWPWEEIHFKKAPGNTAEPKMWRLRVATGWLVATDVGDRTGLTTFVPDKKHRWDPLKESGTR
jgi:hypothetical protein